jgi:hypothetical protein
VINQWIALGVFLLGAGAGALLTHIAHCGLTNLEQRPEPLEQSRWEASYQHESTAKPEP